MTPGPHSNENVGGALLAASATAPIAFWLTIVVQAPRQAWWLLLPIFLVGFVIALLHSAILALPVYWAIRRRWAVTWWNSAATGFLIAIGPSSLLLGRSFTTLIAGGSGAVGALVFWRVVGRGRDTGDALCDTFD